MEEKTSTLTSEPAAEKSSGFGAKVEEKMEVHSEEKASTPTSNSEEKASDLSIKLKNFNGLGRIHKEHEIDQILDWFIETGELPMYVSERQRYSYRHHVRLPERRLLFEQKQRSRTKPVGNTGNVVHLAGERRKRKRGAG